MSIVSGEEFKAAVHQLHQAKDAAYRDAWKKRGEVMSIMANIARKVDRLEYVVGGAPATADESLLDTAVDLLVYTLKYETYLADQDDVIASKLFGDVRLARPYSDGTFGFDALLGRLDMAPAEHAVGPAVADVAASVVRAFAQLESCFQGDLAPVPQRSATAARLAEATVILVGSLARQTPERYRDFLVTQVEETSQCAQQTTPSLPKI